MRIGFLLPGVYGLAGPGNGVRRQAEAQAAAMIDLGHAVVRLDPWRAGEARDYDVIQFFMGGYAHHRIERRLDGARATVFAPIIDTNVSNTRYRLAARMGGLFPRLDSLQSVYRQQALLADGVVCRSEFERRRVVEGLGIPSGKVRTVLNGVSRPDEARGAVPAHPTGVPADFLLFVGAYGNPRKNVCRLIEAIGPTGYPLVIAGQGDESAEAARVRAAADDAGNVSFLGFVTEAEKHALYSACRAFCLPSLYEGTGLAALEAAAVGADVVVTIRGGPIDYFGDFAHYVDPFEVQSIRSAVVQAWEARSTDALRAHVADHLTWEASARSLLAFYEMVLARAD